MLSKKLKRYNTYTILPSTIYNVDISVINTEGVNLSRVEQFLTKLRPYKTETTHASVASS